MNEIEAVDFMMEKFSEDNRQMALQGGMSPEQIDAAMQQSYDSLRYLMNNLYTNMKQAGIIA